MERSLAADLFSADAWPDPWPTAEPPSVAMEPIYPLGLKRHAVALLEAAVAVVSEAPERILASGVVLAGDGQALFNPAAPSAVSAAPVALIQRLVAYRFYRALPARICMGRAVEQAVERWCFALVPVLCAAQTAPLEGRVVVGHLIDWQELLKPTPDDAAAFFEAALDRLRSVDAKVLFAKAFGPKQKAPLRFKPPVNIEMLVDLAGEPF